MSKKIIASEFENVLESTSVSMSIKDMNVESAKAIFAEGWEGTNKKKGLQCVVDGLTGNIAEMKNVRPIKWDGNLNAEKSADVKRIGNNVSAIVYNIQEMKEIEKKFPDCVFLLAKDQEIQMLSRTFELTEDVRIAYRARARQFKTETGLGGDLNAIDAQGKDLRIGGNWISFLPDINKNGLKLKIRKNK